MIVLPGTLGGFGIEPAPSVWDPFLVLWHTEHDMWVLRPGTRRITRMNRSTFDPGLIVTRAPACRRMVSSGARGAVLSTVVADPATKGS